MNKKKIMLKIENEENPYQFVGDCETLRDIIKFKDSDNNYIFDISVERLIKESNNIKIIIDFKYQEMIINEKGNTIRIPMEVVMKKISINNSEIVYKLDKNIIKMTIKEV